MSTFEERQKSLFDQLNEAEKQHNIIKNKSDETTPVDGVIDRQTYRKVKSEMKYLRGQESIFKRPQAPIGRCLKARTVPDYIRNPQKWVHYSLADVTEEQMSDATNRAAAMASIKANEDKNASKSMEVDDDAIFKKPKFHLSAVFKKQTPIKDKAIFKSSKVIMPEYVVGASENKKKNKPQRKIIPKETVDKNNKTELKLQHLHEEED